MIIRLRNQDKIAIHNSYEAHRVMQHIITRDKDIDLTKEHFWTIALDVKKIIVNIELLGIGSSYMVVVPLKNIFYIPYQKNATSVILIHNHPGGSLRPSKADIDLTDRIIQIGRIINIKVSDHLILGGKRSKTNHYYSLHDQGIMDELEFSTKYLLKDEAEALFKEQIAQLHNIIDLQKENNQLIFKEGEKIGQEKGIKKGEKDKAFSIAKAMLNKGYPKEDILFLTGLSSSDIEHIF